MTVPTDDQIKYRLWPWFFNSRELAENKLANEYVDYAKLGLRYGAPVIALVGYEGALWAKEKFDCWLNYYCEQRKAPPVADPNAQAVASAQASAQVVAPAQPQAQSNQGWLSWGALKGIQAVKSAPEKLWSAVTYPLTSRSPSAMGMRFVMAQSASDYLHDAMGLEEFVEQNRDLLKVVALPAAEINTPHNMDLFDGGIHWRDIPGDGNTWYWPPDIATRLIGKPLASWVRDPTYRFFYGQSIPEKATPWVYQQSYKATHYVNDNIMPTVKGGVESSAKAWQTAAHAWDRAKSISSVSDLTEAVSDTTGYVAECAKPITDRMPTETLGNWKQCGNDMANKLGEYLSEKYNNIPPEVYYPSVAAGAAAGTVGLYFVGKYTWRKLHELADGVPVPDVLVNNRIVNYLRGSAQQPQQPQQPQGSVSASASSSLSGP